ncbi:hypothetical protein T4C_9972 [Trichinella pseudospiralis]|uniref:CCHC-type domain-containing protein n=1 Tax=Trichinella pseudospiralis TaxID=6337 RepID=A0A0V1KG31_TRIPS|nr:hypothetical protein T4C_9972 [Trichinella pseudospiralis]
MTTRRRDREFENEQLRSEGGRTGAEAEAEQRTPPGGLLQWGPAWEMTLRGVRTAGYGLLPAFSPVIDPIEWLDTVEDFFLVNDVPSARQASEASSDVASWTPTTTTSLRSSLRYASVDYASERTSRSETLLAKWLKKLRLWEPATLTKARQLTERLVEIEEEIKEGRRRAVNEDATENGGLDKAVDSLARGLEKMEAAQDRPSRLRSTRRPTECFECGDLGHFRRDCPQLRTRTLPARPLNSGIRDRRLLAMMELKAGHATSVVGKLNGLEIPLFLDSGAVVSVVPLSTWQKFSGGEHLEATGGSTFSATGKGCASAARERCRYRDPDKLIDWQARKMTMTDGSKVRIEHDPSRAGQPSIGCAVVAKPQSGGLTWGPVSMGRRIGHVPWWTERSVPLGIRGSCAAFSENLARRDRPCTNEPCKALHRDRRGPAGEAATPSPSSNPAGGAGPKPLSRPLHVGANFASWGGNRSRAFGRICTNG